MSKDDHNSITVAIIIFTILFFLGAMAFGVNFWAIGFATFLGAFVGLIVGAWATTVSRHTR